MGFILIILSIVLLIKRYSTDDFILTVVGVALLAIGIMWKNTERRKVARLNDANQIKKLRRTALDRNQRLRASLESRVQYRIPHSDALDALPVVAL